MGHNYPYYLIPDYTFNITQMIDYLVKSATFEDYRGRGGYL